MIDASFEKVESIRPHANADRLEIAIISGWQVVVGKGEFHVGDVVFYIREDALARLPHWFSTNSSYWVHNPLTGEQRCILKSEKIPNGWKVGRLTACNQKWTDDDIHAMVQEYLKNGFSDIFKTKYKFTQSEQRLRALFARRGYEKQFPAKFHRK